MMSSLVGVQRRRTVAGSSAAIIVRHDQRAGTGLGLSLGSSSKDYQLGPALRASSRTNTVRHDQQHGLANTGRR